MKNYANANGAGLYNQAQYDTNRAAGQNDVLGNPNTFSLYTLGQIQTLNVGTPLLQRTGGAFTLIIALKKTTSLLSPFVDMPFDTPGSTTTIDALGRMQFQFSVPENTQFFRLQAQ